MLAVILEAGLRSALLVVILWIAVTALRLSDMRLKAGLWRGALIASLLMPALMQFLVLPMNNGTIERIVAITGPGFAGVLPKAAAASSGAWLGFALWTYGAVAAALIIRLCFGLAYTWIMTRRSQPLREAWTAGIKVRSCRRIDVPVTFGSTILLPSTHAEWPSTRRSAVMAHERSHVENRDFHWQLLAHLNRAVFWFNPAAWWLQSEISRLDEMISDDAAVETVGDRPHYAEVLLAMSNTHDYIPAGIAMARTNGMAQRIDHVLTSAATAERLSARKRMLLTALTAPLALICAAGFASANAGQFTKPASVGAPHVCLKNYPKEAWQQGKQGRAMIAFNITAQGTTSDIKVARSSGHPELDNASIECARSWLYRPATKNGRPVQVAWKAEVAWVIRKPVAK